MLSRRKYRMYVPLPRLDRRISLRNVAIIERRSMKCAVHMYLFSLAKLDTDTQYLQ